MLEAWKRSLSRYTTKAAMGQLRNKLLDTEKEVVVLRNTMIGNAFDSNLVEKLCNKILSVEARSNSNLDNLAQQLLCECQDNDDVDPKVEDALERTINNAVLGQKVIELVTHWFRNHGASMGPIKAEVARAMDQLHGVTRLSRWNHDHLQLEAVITRLGVLVAAWDDDEAPRGGGPTTQATAPPQRPGYGQGPVPPPGMQASPMSFHIGTAPGHWGAAQAAQSDPWSDAAAASATKQHAMGGPSASPPQTLHPSDRRSPFTEKVVILKKYQIHGARNWEQWRLNINLYIISKPREIAVIVKNLAENEDMRATVSDLMARNLGVSHDKSMPIISASIGIADTEFPERCPALGKQLKAFGGIRRVTQLDEGCSISQRDGTV